MNFYTETCQYIFLSEKTQTHYFIILRLYIYLEAVYKLTIYNQLYKLPFQKRKIPLSKFTIHYFRLWFDIIGLYYIIFPIGKNISIKIYYNMNYY